ncbi:MAG: DUF4190 domain-containing protein [Micromonosporaceae bacterium]|nr:DUF4190 domain-containing protein [Micromonosporaceae bacterium]
MTYPPQPGGWGDPASGAPYVDPASGAAYVDPVTGQPAYPGSPAYPGYQAGQPSWDPAAQPSYAGYGYAAPVMMPAQQGTNGMAIASLVLSLCGLVSCGVTSLVGAILGHVARKQIRERGESGDGMAMAGIITGWIIFALAVVGVSLYVILIVWAVRQASQYPNPYAT